MGKKGPVTQSSRAMSRGVRGRVSCISTSGKLTTSGGRSALKCCPRCSMRAGTNASSVVPGCESPTPWTRRTAQVARGSKPGFVISSPTRSSVGHWKIELRKLFLTLVITPRLTDRRVGFEYQVVSWHQPKAESASVQSLIVRRCDVHPNEHCFPSADEGDDCYYSNRRTNASGPTTSVFGNAGSLSSILDYQKGG
jgi:hypothetical protein